MTTEEMIQALDERGRLAALQAVRAQKAGNTDVFAKRSMESSGYAELVSYLEPGAFCFASESGECVEF